jgi:hypothetical protein
MDAALPLPRLTGRGPCRVCVPPAFEIFPAGRVFKRYSRFVTSSICPSSLFLAIPEEENDRPIPLTLEASLSRKELL